MQILGIDIGGSGIKGAPVDCETGKLIKSRFRIETPLPATPKSIFKTIHELIDYFEWSGDIGCGFPAVINKNIVQTASNIDKKWIGVNISKIVEDFLIAFRWTTPEKLNEIKKKEK